MMRKLPGVRVLPATPNDAAAIAGIVRRSYSGLPEAQVPADMPIYHREFHEDAMRDATTRWAVLLRQNAPVGVAMWRMLPEVAHLHLLFVDGSCHGQGCGTMLLKYHQEQAIEEQPTLRLLTLHCPVEAHRSLRFYKRHGYCTYADGDEKRVTDLHAWIDACRRHDIGWPLKKDKALLYRLARR